MAIGRSLASGLHWLARHVLAPAERAVLVPLVVLAFAAVLYRGDLAGWRLPGVVVTLLLSGLLAQRLLRVYWIGGRFAGVTELPAYQVLQLEWLALSAVTVLLQLTGGLVSPLYPLLWLLVAAVGGLDSRSRRNLWLVLVVAFAFELLPFARPALDGDQALAVIWEQGGLRIGIHLLALVLFAHLSRALVGGYKLHLVAIARRDANTLTERFEQERQEREKAVFDYRLDGALATLRASKQSTELRQQSSLKTLKGRVDTLLKLLLESYRAHAVAFFLLSEDRSTVKLMHQVRAQDAGDHITRREILAGKGAIGAILKRNDSITFDHARWDPDRFHYYTERVDVKTFLGVPVPEVLPPEKKTSIQPAPCGVLVADRTAELPFSDDDADLMKSVAGELLLSMNTERALGAAEKVNGLLAASEELIRAVNLLEVVDEILVQVRNIYPEAEFTAIALRQGDRAWLAGAQTVEAFAAWRQESLQRDIDPDSLCWQAIRDCCVLPARPFSQRNRDQQQVFGKNLPIGGLTALKCLPLKVAGTEGRKSQPGEEKAIGALVLASRDPGLFPADPKEHEAMFEMIGILTNFSAISIQNAQRWEQLERMATTDGLTGLHNHRRFKEMLEEEVAASLRYERHLSMILTDIDHFKSVNDSYGHPMGDEVLRRVARVLGELARESDKVCRYGGEEFTVILPETDATGARMLSERFREKIKEQTFQFEGKQFGITLSLGICTLPDNARHRQELIDRADQALYHAKRNGRDRSVHYADIANKAAAGA
jgi:diguanylate cyclase (GGDEF)-like protein